MRTLLEDVRREVVDLHDFFTDWFNGTADRDLLERRFLSRLDPAFTLIPPEGTVLEAADIGSAFQDAFGMNKGFRIQIRDVTIQRDMEAHVLATYTEWQTGAQQSAFANNARITTVLMEKGTPFQWLHIQETWLPEDVRAAGSFDF
ncbi:MAG: hypothetical protein ACRBM6_26130 [Geminicoccales bacterium]